MDSKTVGQYEYYKVYMVDKEQADRCTIKKENTPLLNCARPDQDVKFTIKFQEFSPNLWGLEFQKNRDYYIICKYNCIHLFYRIEDKLNRFVSIFLSVIMANNLVRIFAENCPFLKKP